MLFMVAAMAAEMERDLIRERTLDGLRAAEAQGRRGGRPAAVDDDVLAVARARQSRGESVTAIARHLKIGRSTLYRALHQDERTLPGRWGAGPVRGSITCRAHLTRRRWPRSARPGRAEALRRWLVLRAHLEDGVPLARVAAQSGIPHRTLQRWLARYRAGGLAGLGRAARADRGRSRFPEPLRLLTEGLALRTPAPSAAHVHRQVTEVAEREGWPVPSYSSVYAIIRGIDPAMRHPRARGLQALQGGVRPGATAGRPPAERDLAGRPHPARPVGAHPAGRPGRPWLTLIEDDHSRAVAGYAVNLGAPSAQTTALAFRQAIWRKTGPAGTCAASRRCSTSTTARTSPPAPGAGDGRPEHPGLFLPARQPRGRGKVERAFGTINQMCLPSLPGYAPRGTADRAGQARLTLAGLDQAIGTFIRDIYNPPRHGETGDRAAAALGGPVSIPRMPDSLEQLDLLLPPWPSRARSTRTASTSRGCATWTRCWPPTSATP